jgi:hypothetical protein
MYRIPKELDLTKAVGEFTTQINVGKYDIQFSFGDVHFAIQSSIKIIKEGKLIASWEEGVWPESGFIEIFNIPISSVQIPDDRTIIIKFENNLDMHLNDNSDQYESMQISIKGESGPWII